MTIKSQAELEAEKKDWIAEYKTIQNGQVLPLTIEEQEILCMACDSLIRSNEDALEMVYDMEEVFEEAKDSIASYNIMVAFAMVESVIIIILSSLLIWVKI